MTQQVKQVCHQLAGFSADYAKQADNLGELFAKGLVISLPRRSVVPVQHSPDA